MRRRLARDQRTILLLVLSLAAGTACIPQNNAGNLPPTADAGSDQTVITSSSVALHGSGTDAEGADLTFAWTQTAGTTVTLSNADSADATFIAPATAGVLSFRLTATDAKNASATDDVQITVTTPPPAITPRLIIANLMGNNVVSYANPSTVNGNIPPDTNLAGISTELVAPADVVIDGTGALLVNSFNGHSITSYANAAAAHGNLAPSRNLSGSNTQLGTAPGDGPASVAINAASDILFVSKTGPSPAILIYTSVSTSGFTGNLAPTRILTNAAITDPIGINLDASGSLYIANRATSTILVYNNPANLNGNLAPDRTITGNPAFNAPFDVFIDKNDRMYVVNAFVTPRISIYNNAATLNGTVAPDFTLTIPGAGALSAIAVDSGGRGYIVEATPSPGKIYSYDGIATLNGTLSPARTIAGPDTQLNEPIRVYLLE